MVRLCKSGVEKVTRSSIKGVLKTGAFMLANMGGFTSNYSPLGHRAFKRQICLKNGPKNVPFRNPIEIG